MRVLILGLGQYPKGSGVSAALYFARRGDDVTVSDFYYTKAMDANVRQLKRFKNVSFVFKKHDLKTVRSADLIVKHQRIRMDEPEVIEALRLGKPIESELSIFLKHCPAKVIGITGTRGKSTTTALIHTILSAGLKHHVWLGGNILVSPLTFLSKIKKEDVVVLEMSSFQLEGTGFAGVSPQVAVWTNILRDHLNAYPSMEEYTEAKAQIFRHQQPNGVVFLPGDRSFDGYAKSAPGRVVRVGELGTYRLKLLGEHNRRNAAFAVAVAKEMGVSASTIKRVLSTFMGLPHRLELIVTKRGISFVNDSAATTPDGAMAALEAIAPEAKRILLIAGGADKELEFEAFAKAIKHHVASFVVLPGTAHKKLTTALRANHVEWTDAKDLKTAVAMLKKQAKSGDVILLSPGCASFGLFKNEFDRGDQFRRLAKR